MAKLTDIEGIGETYQSKLQAEGITTVEKLLDDCCEKKARTEIANKTGVSEKLMLNWVNRADLSRVKGISTQYADLLECAGVDTVPELAQRNTENLHIKMQDVNNEKNLVRQVPGLNQIEDWVAQAQHLPRTVPH